MRSLALDPVTGDLAVSGGRLSLVSGADAVAQRRGGRLVAVVAVDVLAAAGLAAGLCDVLDRAHKVGG